MGARHDLGLKEAARELWDKDLPVRSISARLCIPESTVRWWVEHFEKDAARAAKARTKSHPGSGVIAPAAYHRGSRWWCE